MTIRRPSDGPLGFVATIQDVPAADDPDQTTWTVEARLATADDGIHVLVELTMESDDPTRRVAVGRPRLVDDLLHFSEKPQLGGSAIPQEVLDVDASCVSELVRHLRDPSRTLPVIVFSEPSSHGDGWSEMAERTQKRCRGVAVVVRLDRTAVEILREQLGELAVWGGGVRTYIPAPLDSTMDGWRHRYVPGSRVRANESRTVDQLVLAVSALSARRRVSAPLAALAVAASLGAVADVEVDEENLAQVLEQEREERALIEQQLMRATAHLDRVKKQLRDIDREDLYWEVHAAGETDMPDTMDTVSDAVAAAQLTLDQWLTIPESACQSLEGIDTAVSATAWGNTAWRGLRALAHYAQARAQGYPGGFWQWCQNSGDPLAWPATQKKLTMRESETVTQSRSFMAARYFDVDPAVDPRGKIHMQAHLKIAEGGGDLAPRIYFHDDTDGVTKRIHVGFVGPHYLVPNTKS